MLKSSPLRVATLFPEATNQLARLGPDVEVLVGRPVQRRPAYHGLETATTLSSCGQLRSGMWAAAPTTCII